MATFTPPTLAEVPPVSVQDRKDGPPTEISNRWGYRLMRYFPSGQRGVAVFKMSDGTYQMARQVDGVNVTVQEPYPATTPDMYPQLGADGKTMMLAQAYVYETREDFPAQQPQVALIYYGGHTYTVSAAEAASLTAAGLGAYLS